MCLPKNTFAVVIIPFFRALLIFCCLSAGVLSALGQGTNSNPIDPKRGAAVGASFSISDIENINLTNGNVMLNFPLVSTPKWRGGMSLASGLTYNSKLYKPLVQEAPDLSNQMADQNFLEPNYEGGWRYVGSIGHSITRTTRGVQVECSSEVGPYYYKKNAYAFKVQIVFPDGSKKDFRPYGRTDYFGDGFFNVDINGNEYWVTWATIGGQPGCNSGVIAPSNSNPMVYYSADGSFLRLEVERGDGYTNAFRLYFPDGSIYDSTTRRQTDRNGNYVEGIQFTFDGKSASGAQDGAGRKIFSTVGSNSSERYIYQEGVDGELIRWVTRSKRIYVKGQYTTTGAGHLMERGGTSYQTGEFNFDVIDEIELPQQMGGQKYEFEYYGSDVPLGSTEYSEGWGEIKSVRTPSGAVAEYEYARDTSWPQNLTYTDHILENSITKKTLTYNEEYDGSSNPVEQVWEYGISSQGAGVISPDGSVMTQTHGDTKVDSESNGLVFQVENSNGTKVEKIWDFNRTPWGGSSAQINPFVKAEFTSIKNAAGTYALTAIKEFTQDKNGNTTSVKEYDFIPYGSVPRGSYGEITGMPGGITPARMTYTSYYNAAPDSSDTTTNHANAYWNFSNIKGVVASAEIRNGSGTPVSRTEIGYDNPSTTANPIITKVWDSFKGGTNQPYSNPLSGSNSISSTVQYDQYGNPILATDAKSVQTQITYGDIVGPNGTVSGLYPTQTVAAYGTPVARTSTAVYDFYTGLVTSATDVDNGVTSATEYDALGRPLKSIAAKDTLLEIWTRTEYDDINRRVIVRSDLETKGDGKKVAVQHYDQLGRVRLSRSIENIATEDPYNETHGIKVETRYQTGNPNSYQLTSNPFRAATATAATNEPTMGWTRSMSVNTGRHAETESFSGASLPAPWGSNTNSTGKIQTDNDADRTLVTDQAGKQRISKTNALGQLKDIWEITAQDSSTVSVTFPNTSIGNGYHTTYNYDTLGNLTTVNQGVQTRTFSYNSQSRLLVATNPESGTISYQYDPNGNLTHKTDARTITTSYVYDALNRVKNRNYSDNTTPNVTYTYDNLPNAKGRLTKVSSSVSTTEYTGFDVFGRVTAHKQTTDGTDYATGYVYNLGGALIEETYPSGRVVKNILDNEGDLSIVQSKKNENFGYHTYVSNFTYSAAGAATSFQLGNGKWESTTFNSRLQATQIALGTVQNGTDKLKLNYSYGDWNGGSIDATKNNGNIAQQIITVPTEGSSNGFTATQKYYYDPLNRIDDATENITGQTPLSWRQDFTYDRYGNRNFVEANTTTIPKNCGTPPNQTVCPADVPIFNPSANTGNNKLNGYTFDSSGNTTQDAQLRKFTYDGENKQVKVETVNSGGIVTGTVGEYVYDADGKRIKKKGYANNVLTEETIFVYDAAGRLVAEYSSDIASVNDAKVVYLTNDRIGSPRINTDQNGTVTARHDYHPFGDEITRTGYGSDAIRKQFTGYERDIESELDFAQARYYNSRHGRFTSPDEFEGGSRDIGELGTGDPEKQALPYAEIADPQTLNKYSYCRNNPVRFVDPNGHDWYEDFIKFLSNLWKGTVGGPPSSFGTEPARRSKQGGPIFGLPDEATLVKQSWMTFGAGLDVYARVLETADPTGLTGDVRKILENDTSGLAVSGILRVGGPALSKLFGGARTLFTGRVLFGQNEGTTVAAAFSKSAGNVRADILYVGGAAREGVSTTVGALLKNVLALGKQEGAKTVTVNALAIINSKLAQKLEKAGWTRTKVKVAGRDELMDGYTKTFDVK